MIIRG